MKPKFLIYIHELIIVCVCVGGGAPFITRMSIHECTKGVLI